MAAGPRSGWIRTTVNQPLTAYPTGAHTANSTATRHDEPRYEGKPTVPDDYGQASGIGPYSSAVTFGVHDK